MKFPATLLCDFYKVSHREQYPKNTEYVYSTWTARSNKNHPSIDYVIAFGFQAFVIKYLVNYFNEQFFSRPKDTIIEEYARYIKYTLNVEKPYTKHIEELRDLRYLPIKIMALPEGTKVPIRTPMLTIENTDPRFFWLTNYLETLMSAELWMPSTSATIAHEYRLILEKYAEETGSDKELIQFQAHDFSMRGCIGIEAARLVGAGHLTSFTGTDNIPAIGYAEEYYFANIEDELIGCSIPATEHSVMCAGGVDNELGTYKRLITEVYSTGFISIVSDTWDLWNTLTNILPQLKEEIMSRDGKVVIRPDSGDPVDIICGNPKATSEPEKKGVIQLLWETFGGTVNPKGFKVLDQHIGAIYGDAITLQRADQILSKLRDKGFASSNIVFGVGSYTYQYNTRDTFGFALKSTACKIGGKYYKIYKNPVTDSGTKKSQKGKVIVHKDLTYSDQQPWQTIENELKPIFLNGTALNLQHFQTIRKRIK